MASEKEKARSTACFGKQVKRALSLSRVSHFSLILKNKEMNIYLSVCMSIFPED